MKPVYLSSVICLGSFNVQVRKTKTQSCTELESRPSGSQTCTLPTSGLKQACWNCEKKDLREEEGNSHKIHEHVFVLIL